MTNEQPPTGEDYEDLRDLLTEELRQGVDEGRFLIAGPGQNDKPVVVDAETKRWVTGSGRPLNANDPAYIGKVTAWRRSKVFSEALEQMIPAWEGDSPEAIISFQELIQAAREAVVGEPVIEEHTCSHCGEVDVIINGRKRDNKVLMFLIERLAGAANKTTTVNLHSEELIRLMSDNRVLHDVSIVALSAEERADRVRRVQEAG